MRRPASLVACALAAVLAGCGGDSDEAGDPPPAADGVRYSEDGEAFFVGARVCAECHAERFEGYARTAHFLTSREPSRESVLGSFEPPGNVLSTSNPNLSWLMEARSDGLYQTAVRTEGGNESRTSRRFDIVTGSGTRGQSYLYWEGDQLFQLPISYFTGLDAWTNSPGAEYVDGTANFFRAITPRCIECHATWLESRDGAVNAYDPDSAILGVGCERCHGPGSRHVAYQRRLPDADARYIQHPADLERPRQLEICMQCHSGGRKLKSPAFSYRPGEPLDEHVIIEDIGEQAASGVHSNNQFARLTLSRCFQESETLWCATCHNPHQPEHGRTALFSRRCQSCHGEGGSAAAHECGLGDEVPADGASDCISCHMARVRGTQTVIDMGSGNTVAPEFHDHFIRVLERDDDE